MVIVQDDQRPVTVPGERFIDGIIDNLVDHVMQARPVVRIAYVHPRPLSHGIQSAKDFDAIGAIFVLLLFCHVVPLAPV